MKTKAHKIQSAVLVLAVASLTSAVFPNIQLGVEQAGENSSVSRASVRNESASQLDTSAFTEARASLPLGFESNRGQAEADVKFVGRGDGYALLLKPGEAVLALHKRKQGFAGRMKADGEPCSNELSSQQRVSMKLEGANSTPAVSGVGQQQARANYFIGNDPAKWIRGVETYSRVLYSSVYPGIDLMFYGNQRRLEYDFTLAPGADYQGIKLRFEGVDDLELNPEGALVLHTVAGEVRHERPVAYQETKGSRLQIPADFKRLDDGTIGFQVGDYDPTLPLVIDPVLVYSTYVGGSAADFGRGIVADSVGNAYLVGDSFSSDFLSRASTTNSDIFVGKLSRNGLLLTYSFFGGSRNDSATGLAVDGSGNVYLSGNTESADFPQLNSVGGALGGASDAFVIKLTPENTAPGAFLFEYSSLIGGSGEEGGASLAIDGSGSAYITGRTSSQDFPTVGAIQPIFGGGDSDAFVSKLAPDGKSLTYSSFLGGSGTENSIRKTGISVDASGNAYVAGDTQSTNFPTRNALRPAKTGAAASFDGFVAKINPLGSDFVYSTYVGGSEDDFALAVANDQTGNAYVTGRTRSTSFSGSGSTRPSTANTDAFVAKLNASGSAISYLTFIGGASDESANAIVVDTAGAAVIAGTAGTGSPTVNAIQSFFRGGANDAFIAKLAAGGAVTFSTYLGGSDDDVALAVSLDSEGAIYITGFTDSTDFLTATPLRFDNAGGRDIIIAKIDPNTSSNRPVLLQALISGKNLILLGQGFDEGAVLRINDVPTRTRNEDPDHTQILFAKKAAKQIKAGKTVQLQVENPNGRRSNFLFLTKPLQ
ncbi:MAG: SBBP repeat-containing protein [Acidobacteriota bacterium]